MSGKLVGLFGHAGSGKDTIGEVLVKEFSFTRVAIADPLRLVAAEIGWDGNKDEAGRKLLQDLALAMRDHIHPDVLIDPCMKRVLMLKRGGQNVVVTDIRYANDHQRIFNHGALWEVRRPGVLPANNHVSETALHGAASDITINNNGTLDEFKDRVRKLAHGLLVPESATALHY